MFPDEMDDKTCRRTNHSRTNSRIEHPQDGMRKQIGRAEQNTESNHAGHDDIAFSIKKCECAYFLLRKSFDTGGMLAEKPEKDEFKKQEENNSRHRKGKP